jgi:hypothetical protein
LNQAFENGSPGQLQHLLGNWLQNPYRCQVIL